MGEYTAPASDCTPTESGEPGPGVDAPLSLRCDDRVRPINCAGVTYVMNFFFSSTSHFMCRTAIVSSEMSSNYIKYQ